MALLHCIDFIFHSFDSISSLIKKWRQNKSSKEEKFVLKEDIEKVTNILLML